MTKTAKIKINIDNLLTVCIAFRLKLVFLLGQNNLETIAGYISFIDKGYAVALLDFRLNQLFFKNKLYLVEII